MTTDGDIAVIDLFAGPGGLGEGFSALRLRGRGHPFRIALSVEMDRHAHRTLTLRSFHRRYSTSGFRVPEAYYKLLRTEADESELAGGRCAAAWESAQHEAMQEAP